MSKNTYKLNTQINWRSPPTQWMHSNKCLDIKPPEHLMKYNRHAAVNRDFQRMRPKISHNSIFRQMKIQNQTSKTTDEFVTGIKYVPQRALLQVPDYKNRDNGPWVARAETQYEHILEVQRVLEETPQTIIWKKLHIDHEKKKNTWTSHSKNPIQYKTSENRVGVHLTSSGSPRLPQQNPRQRNRSLERKQKRMKIIIQFAYNKFWRHGNDAMYSCCVCTFYF